MNLKSAILETLAYSDVFDCPMTIEEVHRFLGVISNREDVASCLREMDLIEEQNDYYYFMHRSGNIGLRKKREVISSKMYGRAMFYGRILGMIPFIRMVALTGSLAVRNCDEMGDYDYMLVATPGRVWTARILALVLNKFANIFGETICPNLIVSENMLEWKTQNLYYAHEIAQMVLISGEGVYRKLCASNTWVDEYLPNWHQYKISPPEEKQSIPQKILEYLLSGKLGDMFEAWEMKRKILKLSRQAGFGLETNFNADVCQGNFDHHGLITLDRLQTRLQKFGGEQTESLPSPRQVEMLVK